MSTYSYRSQASKNNKEYPEIVESEPPSFPRPSSSIARSRLKNRLISKSTIASPNNKDKHSLLPVPPKNDRDDEFRHHIRHDVQESQVYRNDNDIDTMSISSRFQSAAPNETLQQQQQQHLLQQEGISESQYSVRFGSTDVVESFGWGSGEESVDLRPQDQEQEHDVKMSNYLHSKIIPSHSLYVPGYESTVPRPPVVQQAHESNAHSDHDPSTVILSSAYGKSFRSNDMEVAVELILSGKKEFCYLEEVDPDDMYRLVLSFNNVSKETRPGRYITLSANGVVRYDEGGMDSVTLREYLREYKYYYRLLKIPVIGQFRKWKSFLFLKMYVLASRRKKRMAFLYPHLFILDKSFQTMLLYVSGSAAVLNEREAARLTKVLFTITSPKFFEIQDTLIQNKSPITKHDLAPKQFENPNNNNNNKNNPLEIKDAEGNANGIQLAEVGSSSYELVQVTKAMAKDEILFHIVCCIHEKVSRRFEHVITDVIPQSLLESNFRYQSSIDMIATRESNRNKSYEFEKAAKKNILEKEKAAALKSNNTVLIQEQRLMEQRMTDDENMSYTQRSANRLNCRRIASAVRIVDFIVRDYLYLAAESCLTMFLTKLKMLRCGDVQYGDIGLKMMIRDLRKIEEGEEGGEGGRDDDSQNEDDVDLNLLALYGIDASFPPPHKHEIELDLYPNKSKALRTLHGLVTQIFDACRHETSLLHHDMLKQIFHPIANELADCTNLDLIFFDEQNSIHDLNNQIADILEQDMTRCERKLREYSFLLETYCRTANEANELSVDILNQMTVEDIAKKLSDIKQECHYLSSLPEKITVGITTLNITDAVQLVLGQVTNSQVVYYKTIPKLFVVLGEQLYHRVHSVKVVLTKQFNFVKDYVEAIEVYNAAVDNVPEIGNAFEFLVGLKKIITDSNIPSTDEMFGINSTLNTEYQKYQLSMSDFEEGMEEAFKHFQKELLSRSKTVIVPIEEIELCLASELFGSPDSDADDVLRSVVEQETKFQAACDESAYLVKCQKLMNFFVFDGLQADRIHQQIVLNKIVWKAVKIIRNLILHIMETHFQDIDCVSVQLKVEAISKALSKLDKHDFSGVEVWVSESITLMTSLLPVIVQLQLNSYTTEQVTEIETLLDYQIYTGGEKSTLCSGQKLIDLQALKFSAEIHSIYHRNVCESNLQQKLHEMQICLEKKELVIAQDRDITYRITNLVECSDMLENLVITTKVCLQSPFVKLLKDEYSLFYEKVQSYDQLVKWIIIFQQEGLQLRALYTNPKITRFVHQGFKYFNVVDESWRSLIKVGRSDSLLTSLLSSSRLKNVEIINNSLNIAFDVVYMYVESQRVKAPRLYFLSDTQCFDMFRNTDMKSIFDLTATTLFPNLSSISLGADGENVFVEGVESGTELIRFKTVCHLKVVLGDWINDIDKTLTEHVIEDIKILVTDERSIIEDARYPICTNQAKLVGLEVKFWTNLKESFQSLNKQSSTEIQRAQRTTILDNIVILSTISSMSKDSYQVQSVANMIICLIQQRDLLQKTFGGSPGVTTGTNKGGNKINSSKYFDEHAFFLECAIQKFYDHKTSEISVRHFSTELSYGYKYLGFSTSHLSMVVTPLTEKCYLAISASFLRASQQMPFLKGTKHGSQVETLTSVTHAFGLELFPVNCTLLDPTAVETAIKRNIMGTLEGQFHTCFTNIEALDSTSYSFLISSLTSTLIKLSEQPKEKKLTKSKFDLWQSIQSSQHAHFSLCLNINHSSEATFFPASIRKRFRPLHIISPRFSEVLATYLEAYGFDTPLLACVRLSGFLEHVSSSCAIDHSLLLKILIIKVIPLVANSLVRSNSVDLSQQCYLVVKILFQYIPSYMHEFLTTRNIQYACSFYLNIYFDPLLHLSDFKENENDRNDRNDGNRNDGNGSNSSSCEKLIAALETKRCAIVIGAIDCGKTSIIREAVGQIEGYGSQIRGDRISSSGPETDRDDLNHSQSHMQEHGSSGVLGGDSSSMGEGGTHETSTDLAGSVTLSLSVLDSDANISALDSRNGIYDVNKSYPKKLFRHQINPLLFDNIEIEPNNLVNKISWSGVSTCTAPMASADRRRASPMPLSNTSDGEDTDSSSSSSFKQINNKRHFDSLDRFLYDISSQDDDISYLHMDITNSSTMSHFMNRLTHNCPNKYSPSLTAMGYKLIWECSEISQIDPGLASSVPIVCIADSHYSPEDTLALQMQYFLTKFDYHLTDEELNKGLSTPLMGCLARCVDMFLRPFLNPTTFESLQAIQSIHVVIRSFFEIATAMYKYIGLDVSTVIHPQLITIIYDRTHEENAVVEKQLWNQVTFYSIMAFASMLSFGSCSPSSHEAFGVVYASMSENVILEARHWPDDLHHHHHLVLPPDHSRCEELEEDWYPFNEYCLQRVDSDDVEMKWVHWKQFTPLAKQPSATTSFNNNPSSSHSHVAESFYCNVNDYYLETLYVPTHLSVLSILLKDALICDKPSTTSATATAASTATQSMWKSKTSSLAIVGNAGVGKSSLLYMLANSMAREHWKGIIDDNSPDKIQNAIHLSQDVYHSYLLENNLPCVGALFIDDVNLDTNAAVDVDTCGAEFYRTLFSDNHFYDPKQRKWQQIKNSMYAICGTLRDTSGESGGQTSTLNQRMLQHCIAFSIPEGGQRLANIFSVKFLAMCPYVKEDLAFDIANITLKLFDQFRVVSLNECSVLPMIRTCPASRQVKYVFAGIAKAFENFPVVSSLELCKQWKRIVANVVDGSFVEKSFFAMLESMVDNTSQHRSNIKGVIYKGMGDSAGGGSRNGSGTLVGGNKSIMIKGGKSLTKGGKSLLNRRSSTSRPTVRSSFRPSLNAMSMAKEVSPCDSITREDSHDSREVYNSMILMTPEDMMTSCLPDIQHIFLDHFQVLDFENLRFWKDIQKCVGYLLMGDAPFALFWGPAKPILNVIVESACFIAKWSYIPFTLDGIQNKDISEFTLQYVHSFCYFLLVAHEKDLKLNNKFVETIRRNRKAVPFEDGTKLIPESMLKLWHIHFNDIDSEVTSSFWSHLLAILQFKIPEIHVILRDVYDISFSQNSHLQQYFMQFLCHVKVVFSFGPNVNTIQAVQELSYVPKLCHKVQNFHYSTVYRMNNSLLLNVFDDVKVSDHLAGAVTCIVTEVAAHSMLEQCFFLELIQNSNYEEGTYDMIGQMFQLSIDPSSESLWDRYSAEFENLSRLNGSVADDEKDLEGEELSSSANENKAEEKKIKQQTKLANVVWTCISARFVTMCEVSLRDDIRDEMLADMSSSALHPRNTDIRMVAYAYMHTLVATGRVTAPEGFVELFDTILLCGETSSSMRDEMCVVLLTLLSEGSVRIIGSSCDAIRLLADLCDLEVRESAFNMHQCDSVDLEDMVAVSEDQTKILFNEDNTRNATRSFTECILSLPIKDAKAGKHNAISRRSAVLVFDMQNEICADIFVLYFLVKGYTHNQKLFESFVHFNRLAKLLNMNDMNTITSTTSTSTSDVLSAREQVLSKMCDDTSATKHREMYQTLAAQWAVAVDTMTPLCRAYAALSSSVASLHPMVYKGMSDQLLTFMSELSFKQKAAPMEITLQELLTCYYKSLVQQINECVLLTLKMNMVILLTEPDHRVSHSLVSQIFRMLQKRQGLLGLHCSSAHNDDIIPTNASFDVMNMTFEYLNQVGGDGGGDSTAAAQERIHMDDLHNLFLKYSDNFEEWANMYSIDDAVLPLPEDVLSTLSYTERLVIVAVLKPVALKEVIAEGIVELSTWDVSIIERTTAHSSSSSSSSSCELKESPSVEEEEDEDGPKAAAVILLYENPCGVFDLSTSTNTSSSTSSSASSSSDHQLVPYYCTSMLLAPPPIATGGNGSRNGNTTPASTPPTSTREHILLAPESDASITTVLHYLTQKPLSLCDGSIIECQGRANVPITQHMKKSNILVKKINTLSLMWYNFPALLKNTLESLLGFHDDHTASIMTAVKLAIPKLLVRAYWLLAIYHVSVLIRLQPFQTSMGDDTLKYAGRLLMQLRVRSVHAPELLFSKLNTLIKQLYHQVYDLTADSSYVKSISYALFQNIFTDDATDPDLDYYLLGLLPLPSTLDAATIAAFVDDIEAVLGGGECIHTADFLGSTNGELYEVHLKKTTLSVLQESIKPSPPSPPSASSATFAAIASYSFVSPPLPLLSYHHHRILPAVTFLLAGLPPLLAINEEADDAMLKSLCASQKGNGKRHSTAFIRKGSDISGDCRKNNNNGRNSGENHLWFYLQLEIEAFNTSLVVLRDTLSSMLQSQTCPPHMVTTDVLEKLEQNCVPAAWLKISFDENQSPAVSLSEWVRQLYVRRKMLNVWLTQRYPEYIYLHLLQNPDGFMYALKQCFAEMQNKPYEDVVIDARILKLPYTSLERHNEIAKISKDNFKFGVQAYSVVVAGAHMMNARWLEEHYNLEFLNPSFASKFSQELYLKISATCEDCQDEDDFQCPVYTSPDFPTSDSIATSNGTVMLRSGHREPLFHVSVPSQCSLVEWKKRNVTMHASPDWHIPDV